MRVALTTGIWIVSLVSLALGGLIAAEFIFMATSLDPTQMITAGAEPWTDALEAGGAFTGLIAATVLGLALWHTTRFRIVGLLLTIGDAACVAWACVKVYNDYF